MATLNRAPTRPTPPAPRRSQPGRPWRRAQTLALGRLSAPAPPRIPLAPSGSDIAYGIVRLPQDGDLATFVDAVPAPAWVRQGGILVRAA